MSELSNPGRPSEYDIDLAVEDLSVLVKSGDEIIGKTSSLIEMVLDGRPIPKKLKAKYPGWTQEDFEKFQKKFVDREN